MTGSDADADAGARPVPVRTALTEGYWDAAARGELAFQRCGTCRRFTHPPRPACSSCGSADLAFEAVSGRGRLESYSTVHRSFAPGFIGREPYVLAWVELPEQEGLRVLANIIDDAQGALEVDCAVEVVFEEIEGFGPIPQFRVVPGSSGAMTRGGSR